MSAPKSSVEPVWERERDFHDALAAELDVDALERRHHCDDLDVAMLTLAGPVQGRRVLDAGCGQGDLTLHLLEQGALVTALDVSPGMVGVVSRRAEQLLANRGELATVIAPLEATELPDGTFDLVLGRFVLHHIDVATGAAELRRVLRPGGRAIFIENAGDNPLLKFARDRLAGRWGIPRLGTEDEHPLTLRDINEMRTVFPHLATHYPVFQFFVLFDRQVLRFKYPPVTRAIQRVDRWIRRRIPRLRRYSYRVIVELGA